MGTGECKWVCACCPELNDCTHSWCAVCGSPKPLRLLWQRGKTPREYQIAIAESCVKQNTLVALPTGLGKTAIAACAARTLLSLPPACNDSALKAVFLAPTRPLVLQLAREVRMCGGWGTAECVALTGASKKWDRVAHWSSRTSRVIFATSKVFVNDVDAGVVPPETITVAVVDEVHHATGQHPHAVAVRYIQQLSPNARLIGLSASPGKDGKAVQGIIDALNASKIEARSECDAQVKPYCHDISVEVRRAQEATSVRADASHTEQAHDLLLDELRPIAHELYSRGILKRYDPPKDDWLIHLSPYTWLQIRRSTGPGHHQKKLAVAQMLSRTLQALQRYGPAAAVSEVSKGLRTNKVLAGRMKIDEAERLLMRAQSEGVRGSPKLEVAVEVVREHLQRNGSENTRVIVFTSRRESVTDTVRALRCVPGARPLPFVGQATASSGADGMKQDEQSAALNAFRSLTRNILVATSVAEEGLDVANVDLAVIFDSVGARRIAQRMGRAGRARDGRVVALAGENKEASSFESDMDHQLRLLTCLAHSDGSNFSFQLASPPSQPVVLDAAEVLVDPAPEAAENNSGDQNGIDGIESELRHGKLKPLELSSAEQVSKILHGPDPCWRPCPNAQVYRLRKPSKTAYVRHSYLTFSLTQILSDLRSGVGWPGGRPTLSSDTSDMESYENVEAHQQRDESLEERNCNNRSEEVGTPRCWILDHEAECMQEHRKKAMRIVNNLPQFICAHRSSQQYVHISSDGKLHVEYPPEFSSGQNQVSAVVHLPIKSIDFGHGTGCQRDNPDTNQDERSFEASKDSKLSMDLYSKYYSHPTEHLKSMNERQLQELRCSSEEVRNSSAETSEDVMIEIDQQRGANEPHEGICSENNRASAEPDETCAMRANERDTDSEHMPPPPQSAITPSASKLQRGSKLALGSRKRRLNSSSPSPVPMPGLAATSYDCSGRANPAEGTAHRLPCAQQSSLTTSPLGNAGAGDNIVDDERVCTRLDIAMNSSSACNEELEEPNRPRRKLRRIAQLPNASKERSQKENVFSKAHLERQIAQKEQCMLTSAEEGNAPGHWAESNRVREEEDEDRSTLESPPRRARTLKQPRAIRNRMIDDEAEGDDNETSCSDGNDEDDRSGYDGSFVTDEKGNLGADLSLYRRCEVQQTPESKYSAFQSKPWHGCSPGTWYSQPEPPAEDVDYEEDEELADFIVNDGEYGEADEDDGRN